MTPSELTRFMNDSFHDREWNGLRRVLLAAIDRKDIMCLEAFLSNPKGQNLFTGEVIQKLSGTQWDEGWARVVDASLSRPPKILLCLKALRSDAKRFDGLLQKICNHYAGVSKASVRHDFDEILLGVMALAVEYSDEPLFDKICQRLSLNVKSENLFNYVLIDCAINNNALWALKKMMAPAKDPTYVVLRWIVSFPVHTLVPSDDLWDLVTTAFRQDPTNTEFLPQALNLAFPLYDDMKSYLAKSAKKMLKVCRDIDALCVQHNLDRSSYSSEIFTRMAQAYCEGHVSAKEAVYWCRTVWNERVTNPNSGAGGLSSMLGTAVYASVQHNRWDVVKSLHSTFAESFEIVLPSLLKTHVFQGELLDKMVDQIDGDLLESVVRHAHSTPKVNALRQKYLLTHAVATETVSKKTPKRKM